MSAPDRETVRIAMTYPQTDGISSVLRANARDVAARLRIIAGSHKVWVSMTSEMALQLADQLDPQPQPVSKTQ